jgi:hypothetical protein
MAAFGAGWKAALLTSEPETEALEIPTDSKYGDNARALC